MELISRKRSHFLNTVGLLIFTGVGFLVAGYHPGAEDDALYLSAVKINLTPTLFPHDSQFFKLQLRTTVFDTWMAAFIHGSGIPVAWAELTWQFLTMLLIVVASWTIIRQLFEEARAQWAGIAMLTAMFTLPVAGTALYIVDQYLEPRAAATALILFAVSRILAGKSWQAVPLLTLTFIIHPLMGALGISFCCVLTMTLSELVRVRSGELRRLLASAMAAPVAAFIPFGWMFGTPSPIWLHALGSRHWFRLFEWTWYEWLGAIGPLVIFWIVAQVARKQGQEKLAQFSMAIVFYGIFQQAFAMIILGPHSLIAFSALEPMRYLHLVYVFLTLVAGGYLGKHILKARIWRWTVFLIVANGGMLYAQRQLFASTYHLEMPGRISANPWLQAFSWIQRNTPQDAYFALDPNYMAAPGEDYHGFRALAERSALADAIKDTSMVTKVPELGPVWERQLEAQQGWKTFQIADFERLKSEFGVDWVVVSFPQPAGLDCKWHNDVLAVCEIP
jgi:hypothetical protein